MTKLSANYIITIKQINRRLIAFDVMEVFVPDSDTYNSVFK